MDILIEIEKYKKAFDISISIDYRKESQGQWLVFNGNRAVLHLDDNSLPDVAQFIAQIKMGMLYHPLLATFFFQKNLSEKEGQYARMFHALAEPLIDIWVVQIQSRYMGESAFANEIDEINIMNEAVLSGKLNADNIKTRRLVLSGYLFTKTFVNANVELKIVVKSGDSQDVWNQYVNFLEDAAKREPNIDDILQLPILTQAPYVVKVKNKPYIHFEIKENKTGENL